MGETISRDELAREVADRLDADPALVMRRVVTGAGDAAGAARAAGSSRRAAASPPARPISARERRERALLSMSIREPSLGRDFLARLSDEHLSSAAMRRTRAWLGEHLDDPLRGLPRDDDELLQIVTDLKMSAEREPASREAMELNFLELDLRLVEDRIAVAERAGGPPPVELQRQRAELTDRISGREVVSGA